jgi:hypothetical protein
MSVEDTAADAAKFDEDIEKSNAIKRYNYDIALERLLWNMNIVAATTDQFFSIKATLVIGGVVLTGDLISGLEYFKHYADKDKADRNEEAQTKEDDTEEFYAKTFREEKAFILKSLEDKTPINFDYFHMKNAAIVSGGSCGEAGFIWRGKISEISAFSWQQLVMQNVRVSVTSR